MKKIYFLLIAFLYFLPQSFTQEINGYNEHLSWLFHADETLNYGALLLSHFVIWLVLGGLYYLIARFETSNHLIDIFPKEGQKFLYIALVISIGLHIVLAGIGLGILLIRVIFAFYISSDARDLGRSKLLWWILIFIEPNVALLILANVPKLIRVKGKDKTALEFIFTEYDDKLDNLESLRLSGVIEGREYRTKRDALDNLYMHKRDEFLEEKDQEVNNSVDNSIVLGQLEKALEDGILTQEEYEIKKSEILGNEG